MTQAELDELKRRLALELARRRDAELKRHQLAVGEVHTLAHRAVLEAADEGEAYEAISLFTRALALLRGVPLNEVRT